MNQSIIAQKGPYIMEVVEGKSYYWCQCGLSNKQPFCDGSHKETNFKPILYKATENKKYISADVKTSKQPLSDGSHKKLK